MIERKAEEKVRPNGGNDLKKGQARTGSSGQTKSVEDCGGDWVKGGASNWGFRGYA